MSIILYPIPETQLWIDEAYNLCDCEGVLYSRDGFTVTFRDWIATLGPTLRKRQGYTNIPPPSATSCSQLKRWKGPPGTPVIYGTDGEYIYTCDNSGRARPVQTNANGVPYYCQTDMMQALKRSVQAQQPRMAIAQGNAGNVPTGGLTTIPF
jgi:hypothetical protein